MSTLSTCHTLYVANNLILYNKLDDYDGLISNYYKHHPEIQALLEKLIHDLSGSCLDVGCGTGILSQALRNLGFDVTGLDISRHQLDIATREERVHRAILADASRMPLENNLYDIATSIFTHTDFDDWPGTVKEIHRVLKPGGYFVYVGAHPCFFGGHIVHNNKLVSEVRHKYYRKTDRVYDAPGFSKNGLRERVGERHHTLESLLSGFLDAGFIIQQVLEDTHQDLPFAIGNKAKSFKDSN